MDIREMAYLIHSNREWSHLSGPKDGPLYTMDSKAYGDYLAEANRKRWDSGEAQEEFLYAGSETRAALSETEIAALANKYDPRRMDDEAYDNFLDDLESMGVISRYEKETLGYHGLTRLGYVDANGKLIDCASGAWVCAGGPDDLPFHTREEADGDIFQWLNDRFQWRRCPESDQDLEKAEAGLDELHRVLAQVVNRMQARREESAEGREKEELIRQLADADSEFYENLRLQLKEQLEKAKEDQQEQAVIEAMAKVLDALSGREDAPKNNLTMSTGEIARQISEMDPEDPKRTQLERFLERLQQLGIYFDLGDLSGDSQEETEFETLTQLLARRRAQQTDPSAPQ